MKLSFLPDVKTDLPLGNESPDVVKARKKWTAAVVELEALQAKEKYLIRVVNPPTVVTRAQTPEQRAADAASPEQVAEAEEQLSIRKGTQTGWYYAPVDAARARVATLESEYQTILGLARRELTTAAREKLKAIAERLVDAQAEASAIAKDLAEIRAHAIEAGAESVELPDPVWALVEGGHVDFQLDVLRRHLGLS